MNYTKYIKKYKKAFSLIELIIVMSLFIILFAISAPLFFPENIKFDSWANSLYNSLYRAKMAAIINLYEVGFICLDNRNYLIFLDNNRNTTFDNNDRVIFDSRNIFNDFNNRNSSIQNIIISSPNNLNQSVLPSPNNVIFRFNSLGFLILPNNNNFNLITFDLRNNRVIYRYFIVLTSGGDINIRKISN